MRKSVFTFGIVALVAPAAAHAASQPITIAPGRVVFVCPNSEPAIVCTQKIPVAGGAPISGYTFSVKSGTTLPRGLFLVPATGVITAASADPALPQTPKRFWLTASDGSKTGSASVSLQIHSGTICPCGFFSGGDGALPEARAHQPYAVALPVSGPNSYRVLRPNYTWKAAGKLPPGLVLDQARGVLRGTPLASASGKTFTFTVNIKENKTGWIADVYAPYTLHVR
jgi:hypothetical protein